MESNQSAEKKRRVLIADTDPDSRIIVSSIIAVLGHTPVVVQNGQEAIIESESGSFDLAILDYTISDVDGLEVCNSIKRRHVGDFIPVLMLTDRDTLSDKVKAFAEGVDDYLTKPFHYEELQARVNAMLRSRDLHHQLKEANEELRLTQARLIEQERQLAVGQLAGTAAHQLGQPLSSILLNCFLIDQLPKSDAKFVSAVNAIKNDAKRMSEMIDQLRTVKASEKELYVEGAEILKLSPDPRKKG
jgi:DNA-binding response OmpR family regulator